MCHIKQSGRGQGTLTHNPLGGRQVNGISSVSQRAWAAHRGSPHCVMKAQLDAASHSLGVGPILHLPRWILLPSCAGESRWKFFIQDPQNQAVLLGCRTELKIQVYPRVGKVTSFQN